MVPARTWQQKKIFPQPVIEISFAKSVANLGSIVTQCLLFE
jgi:hypothetical protein